MHKRARTLAVLAFKLRISLGTGGPVPGQMGCSLFIPESLGGSHADGVASWQRAGEGWIARKTFSEYAVFNREYSETWV